MARDFSDNDFTCPDAARGNFNFRPGQVVLHNRYELIREIGTGGMATVWLATDRVLEKSVALKFLPSLFVRHEEEMKRLRDEVNTGTALSHPRIVRTNTMEVEGQLAAIVMEYAEGETLRQKLLGHPGGFFEPVEIIGWLGEIAGALDYLHSRRPCMVHRDLKPGNVMIGPDNEARLMDFGISQQVLETLHRCTGQGEVSGVPGTTLMYASPRQLDGENGTPADDLYSFGVVIYELLTGNPPFYRGGAEAVALAIRHDRVPSMRKRRREMMAKSGLPGEPRRIPRKWNAIVGSLLEKDSRKRPQMKAGDVVQQLREVRLPPLRPWSPDGDGVSMPRSRRKGILAAALAVAAGCGALVLIRREPDKTVPPPVPPAWTTVQPVMPKALFTGIPAPASAVPPNLDRSAQAPAEFRVPAVVSLLSRGKPVSSSDPAPRGRLSTITDGHMEADDKDGVELLPSPQWVQIDLGASVKIHLIWLWHAHRSAGVYFNDVIVQISDDADFKTGTTVFNNDDDNSSGLGAGKDPVWVETARGRPIPVNGVAGRYVRLWSNGSNIDDTSHCLEAEVYGATQ